MKDVNTLGRAKASKGVYRSEKAGHLYPGRETALRKVQTRKPRNPGAIRNQRISKPGGQSEVGRKQSTGW